MKARGFTLVELIMTLTIAGVLATGVVGYIDLSMQGYVDSVARQRMAATMVVASEKMTRELRESLPNSIRVGGNSDSADNCIEFIPILVGVQYSDIPLDTAATSFSASAHTIAAPVSAYVTVYPIDTNDIYQPSDSVPASMTAARATFPVGTNAITVSLGAAHSFLADSPARRAYGVDTPVTYCQPPGSARLYRYSGYGFNAAAVLPPTGGTRAVVADELSMTSPIVFSYAAATQGRSAVVGFELTAADQDADMVLAQEVQVRNVP